MFLASRTCTPRARNRDGHDNRDEDPAVALTLSLSFNNDGPLGSFFRYIGDSGTYIARYDDLQWAREPDRP